MMNINLREGQWLFITSDTHAFHKNICAGLSTWEKDRGQRNFQTLDEMNDTIVNNINARVAEDDILIHIGDFAFGGEKRIREFRERLNVKDIRLILGNHDHPIRRNEKELQKLFTKVCILTELRYEQQDFVLSHFPLATWEGVGRGVMMLHGHTHKRPEKRFGKGRMLDVGLDGNPSFHPYTIEEIIELLKDRPIDDYIEGDYHKREGL